MGLSETSKTTIIAITTIGTAIGGLLLVAGTVTLTFGKMFKALGKTTLGMKMSVGISNITRGLKTMIPVLGTSKLAMAGFSLGVGALAIALVGLGIHLATSEKRLREFNEKTIASMNESTEKIKQNTNDIKGARESLADIEELQTKIDKTSNSGERAKLEEEMIAKKQALIDLMPELTEGMDAETTSQLELNKALDDYIKGKERENELESRKQRNEAREFLNKNKLNSGTSASGKLQTTLSAEKEMKFAEAQLDKLSKMNDDTIIRLQNGTETTVKSHKAMMQARFDASSKNFDKENTLIQQTYDAYKALDPKNLTRDQLKFIDDFENYDKLLGQTKDTLAGMPEFNFNTENVKSSSKEVEKLKKELKDSEGYYDSFSASSKTSMETMMRRVEAGTMTVEKFREGMTEFEISSKKAFGENASSAKVGMDKILEAFSKQELTMEEYSATMKSTSLLTTDSMKWMSKSAQDDMATIMNRFNNAQVPIKDLGKTLELTSQMGKIDLKKFSDKSREMIENLSTSFANGEISIVDFEKIVSSMSEYASKDFSKLDAKSQETIQNMVSKLPEGGSAIVDFESAINGMSIRSSIDMKNFDEVTQTSINKVVNQFNNGKMTAQEFESAMSLMSLLSSDAMSKLDGDTQTALGSLVGRFNDGKITASDFSNGVMSSLGIAGTNISSFSSQGQQELLNLISQFMGGKISAEELKRAVENLKSNPEFASKTGGELDSVKTKASVAKGEVKGVATEVANLDGKKANVEIKTTKTVVEKTIKQNPMNAPMGSSRPSGLSLIPNSNSSLDGNLSRTSDNKIQVLSSEPSPTMPMDTTSPRTPSSSSDGKSPATGGNVEISQDQPKNPNLRDAKTDDEKRKQEEAIRERETMESNALREIEELRNKLAQALKKKFEKQRDDELKILDEKLKAIEKNYDEQKKLLDKSTNEKIEALNKEKDALNGNREEDYQATVDALKKEKAMWEQNDSAYAKGKVKELEEKLKDAEKALRNKQIDDEIDALNKAQDEKEKILEAERDKQIENLEKQKEEKEKYWEQQLSDQNIYNEANKLVLSKNINEMVNLVKEYAPEWDSIGLLFGESLVDGIRRGLTDGINAKDFMDGVKDKYEQAKPSYETAKNPSGASSSSSGNTAKPDTSKSGKGKVVGTNSLNVRDGAGTNYAKSGILWRNEEIKILDEKNGWYYIDYYNAAKKSRQKGWSAGNYIQKFHTGGIIGKMTSDEGIAMVQSGERVLSREQTGSFDKLVYDWIPKLTNMMQKFNNLKASTSIGNSNSTNQTLNFYSEVNVTASNELDIENVTDMVVKGIEDKARRFGCNLKPMSKTRIK